MGTWPVVDKKIDFFIQIKICTPVPNDSIEHYVGMTE